MSKEVAQVQTVLIVEPSEDFRLQLAASFGKHYAILTCSDGIAAMELLRQHRPEILILSLFLPGMDGLYFLEEAGDLRPPVILCTTVQVPNYIMQAAQDLGVGYIIRKPCPVRAVVNRVADMLRKQQEQKPDNPQAIIGDHLLRLGYASHLDGFQQLRVGVPLFAQDPHQLLTKELYPAIASLCGITSRKSVEHSIRTATNDAWSRRDEALWKEYFPHHRECPSNKEVLSRLAEFLRDP